MNRPKACMVSQAWFTRRRANRSHIYNETCEPQNHDHSHNHNDYNNQLDHISPTKLKLERHNKADYREVTRQYINTGLRLYKLYD